MATTNSIALFRGAATTNTATVLYTVPASTTAVVTNIAVTNTGSSSYTFTLALDGVALHTTTSISANTTIYIDCNYKDYIYKEQPNTKLDLSERIKPYDNEKQNNILVSFDVSKLTNQSFHLLTQLPEIIKNSGEIGTFILDIFTIDIIHMTEYQNNLIKL